MSFLQKRKIFRAVWFTTRPVIQVVQDDRMAQQRKEIAMFWIVIFCIMLAAVFVKLGALSVWVSVLSGLIKVLFFVAGGVVLYVIWKKLTGRKTIDGYARRID